VVVMLAEGAPTRASRAGHCACASCRRRGARARRRRDEPSRRARALRLQRGVLHAITR
jgi:hypothetical protein